MRFIGRTTLIVPLLGWAAFSSNRRTIAAIAGLVMAFFAISSSGIAAGMIQQLALPRRRSMIAAVKLLVMTGLGGASAPLIAGGISDAFL